jgi:hypothetical protein
MAMGQEAPSTTVTVPSSTDAAAETTTGAQGENEADTSQSEAPVPNGPGATPASTTTTSTTTTEAGFLTDDGFAALEAAFADSADDGEPLDLVQGPEAYLGGAPDEYSAAAIRLGLEQAGVDISGISLSVLPVNDLDASLLVMELGDEYFESGFPTETEGSDITGALLALPEIDTASITQLVTVYRGEDEEGPYAMTFVVSIAALRDAYATGSDLGDALLVQVDRGS